MNFITQIPSQRLPIYIIGAGGIVNTAHLPAYKIAGFDVQGIYDIDFTKAETTAKNFNIPNAFKKLDEMVQHSSGTKIFDIAVPGSQTISILNQLPDDASVLLQKPMGESFEQAKEILQ